MKLNKAILEVLKILPKSAKSIPSSLYRVRFQRANSLVYASDGESAIAVRVDQPVPDALLDAGFLGKAARDQEILSVTEKAYKHLELRTRVRTYRLESDPWENFVVWDLPPAESYWNLSSLNWKHVQRVLHATGRESESAVVLLSPDWVEATDRVRLARAEIPGSWEAQISARAIQKFSPKTDVQICCGTTHVWVHAGDVWRAAATRNGYPPGTDKLVPADHEGPWVLVPTEDFRGAVKQGAAISGLGVVLIDIGAEIVQVQAWQSGGVGDEYHAAVPIVHRRGEVKTSRLMLNAKLLYQSLREVYTPNVGLGYGREIDPLRVEAGVFTAVLWQMIP